MTSPDAIENRIAKRNLIFLIGYRGSGKTTVARLLAQHLGWDWQDADAVLENRYSRTIRQIFADEGESGFRDKECAVLKELCRRQEMVLATGGGVVLRTENRQCLRSSGWVIWLTASPDALWQRLQFDQTTAERRPRLSVGGLAEVVEMLRVRDPLYRACANFIVDTNSASPDDVAAFILNAWSRHTAEGKESGVKDGGSEKTV